MNDIEKATIAWNKPKGKGYKHKTTDYYLLDEGNNHLSIFISASGDIKHEPEDWQRNFNFFPKKVTIGNTALYVHRGFYEALLELLEGVHMHLAGVKSVSITGVSLGGGIAQLLNLYLRLTTKIEVTEVVTFGSPKVFGNSKHKGFLTALCMSTRVTNYRMNNDIVPLVPFSWMGYSEVGHKVQLTTEQPKPANILEWIKRPFMDHGSYWYILKG